MVNAALQELRRPSGQPKDKCFLRDNCSRAELQQALAESPRRSSPQNLVQRAGGEMQEETTKFNNSASLVRSGRGQLLPRTAQAQGESPPEPDSIFFKTVLGLEFRLVLHLQSWS